MKKSIIFVTIILIVVAGVVIYINYNLSENIISEQEAAKIALEAVINDGRKDWLKPECVSAYPSEKNPSVIVFDLNEVHNISCGGDENTSPRITSVLVNLKTGEVYDQPTIIDIIDQGWRTVRIEGKDYQVTRKLR